MANRDEIVSALWKELVGPSPAGPEIDLQNALKFEKTAEAFGPWRQKGTGDEILIGTPPTRRYGIGVLYPLGAVSEEIPLDQAAESGQGMGIQAPEVGDGPYQPDDESDMVRNRSQEITKTLQGSRETDGGADFDLSLTATYRPSSIGLSFLAEFPPGSQLRVECIGGRYRRHLAEAPDREITWWVRQPVSLSAVFDESDLVSATSVFPKPSDSHGTNTDGLDLRIEIFSRPHREEPSLRLVTVCLVNRSAEGSSPEAASLFQSSFSATVVGPTSQARICPYPDLGAVEATREDQALDLLYRSYEIFAVGHGCAADWTLDEEQGVTEVRAECLPSFDVPSISPDVVNPSGKPVSVSMSSLAGQANGDDGFESLDHVIGEYESWIGVKTNEAKTLENKYAIAALANLESCRSCADRMRDGLEFLKSDPQALQAFRLANEAILLQQIHTRSSAREPSFDSKNLRWQFSEEFSEPDPLHPLEGQGQWRAFQIAFILMSLRSVARGEDINRETVELIWFPTGGGKTEAYLGLAAFSVLLRRLRNPDDAGTNVLMRYTLRLLTTQQFQRACRLVSALEFIRLEHSDDLGGVPFSIGLWVGSSSTPNHRKEALKALTALNKDPKTSSNPLVVDQCPWCGAKMGPVESRKRLPAGVPKVLGYERVGDAVHYKCPDSNCPFHKGLPIFVVDEDIYESRPSIVIGTVDKFASMAWEPKIKTLFGLDEDGQRVVSPPGLIIQDELHLISGPLGSMVGLYESVIAELCTDRRGDRPIPPKIVCSTATIRRYRSQIRSLYARDKVVLFPPPGIEIGDSFFGHFAKGADGKLLPGTRYVGIHAPGLGSMQTVQVRTITALLQSPMPLKAEERDPWWTLMIFFNSLRELGTTLSLLQSDIPDYQRSMFRRSGWGFEDRRSFWNILELTGRASDEKIPKALRALEVSYPQAHERPVDICLASSILEVGVDIDRLSLMVIVGQPKTTSQYIQVTGRIGRRWWERPGLVVTLYSASKPRDRSHFEKFRSYHERLYAQVEPTSVTPFSPPALDRALHAVMASYARQAGDEGVADSPFPYPEGLIDELRKILSPRVQEVNPEELDNFNKVFDHRAKQWETWKHTKWRGSWQDDDIPLLRVAGEYATPDLAIASWQTPLSMRTVDAECIAEIMSHSLLTEDDDAE